MDAVHEGTLEVKANVAKSHVILLQFMSTQLTHVSTKYKGG